jgi:hypothetical protein
LGNYNINSVVKLKEKRNMVESTNPQKYSTMAEAISLGKKKVVVDL